MNWSQFLLSQVFHLKRIKYKLPNGNFLKRCHLMENQRNLPSILAISHELVFISSLTKKFHLERVIFKVFQIKREPLEMISQQTSLRAFFYDMPFNGESDEDPQEPGHKPRTDLSFFLIKSST